MSKGIAVVIGIDTKSHDAVDALKQIIQTIKERNAI
jgi:mannitol/fructose-specific phosphotransferase system IIA component